MLALSESEWEINGHWSVNKDAAVSLVQNWGAVGFLLLPPLIPPLSGVFVFNEDSYLMIELLYSFLLLATSTKITHLDDGNDWNIFDKKKLTKRIIFI